MSLPTFPNIDTILSREEALNAILTSIAMEELALAQLIKVESEKISHAIKAVNPCDEAHLCLLLEFNDSAANLMELINDMQMILKNKLRLAISRMPVPDKPCPPPDKPCPPTPPSPPCTSIFTAKYFWQPCKTLALEQVASCHEGPSLGNTDGASYIVLPSGQKYKVQINLSLSNKGSDPVSIELRQEKARKEVFSKKYNFDEYTRNISLNDELVLESVGDTKNILFLRLRSAHGLGIGKAEISIAALISRRS